MSLRLFAFTCGRLRGDLGRLMEGGEGQVELPVPAYLIEHPKGTALFDTGMHQDCQRDPAGRLGARLAKLFAFDYRPGEEISARLRAIGRDPERIDLVITSHFHFDHVGGNAQIPNAVIVVQEREWQAGMDPDLAAVRGFDRRDFDLGHPVRKISGEHDLFGDGSVVCLPADPWPHPRPPVAETAARPRRDRARRRCLLFLPHPARAPAAALRPRPRGDAGLARSSRAARGGRRPHLLRT